MSCNFLSVHRTGSKAKKEATNRKRIRAEYDSDDSSIEDATLTTAQKHELRMAQIELKRQKLELECQERKIAADIRKAQLEAKARRQREKHELVMHLMAFVTGGAGRDSSTEDIERT